MKKLHSLQPAREVPSHPDDAPTPTLMYPPKTLCNKPAGTAGYQVGTTRDVAAVTCTKCLKRIAKGEEWVHTATRASAHYAPTSETSGPASAN